MSYTFTVTVSRGLEQPLAKELRQMGLQRVVEDRGAVRFMGRLIDGYRACLWTRIGSRVLLRLARSYFCLSGPSFSGLVSSCLVLLYLGR